jgi:hypothetical protein
MGGGKIFPKCENTKLGFHCNSTNYWPIVVHPLQQIRENSQNMSQNATGKLSNIHWFDYIIKWWGFFSYKSFTQNCQAVSLMNALNTADTFCANSGHGTHASPNCIYLEMYYL